MNLKNKKHISFIFFSLAFILFKLSLVAKDNQKEIVYPNGTAAVVEDRIITIDELNRSSLPFIPQLQREVKNQKEFEKKFRELQQEILESKIDEVLLVKDFKEIKKGQIPRPTLEMHFSKLIEERFQGDRTQFRKYLEMKGQTEREFKASEEDNIIVAYSKNMLKKRTPNISPNRIFRYYKDNKKQFLQKESVHIRQIVLKSPSNDDQEMSLLKEKVQTVVNTLQSGKSFQEVAKQFSEDEMKNSGGNWGWINKDAIRKELADVAFSLPITTYSKPIFLDKHAFILYIENKKKAGYKKIAEVRPEIEKILLAQSSKEVYINEVERLRKKAYIKYFL